MTDTLTAPTFQKLLDRLPREHDGYEEVTRRVRFTVAGGRTVFAFVRAGDGKLAFAGWEMRAGMTAEDDWEYFVLAAEKPGDPLQLINKKGPLGVVVAAELEDRASKA